MLYIIFKSDIFEVYFAAVRLILKNKFDNYEDGLKFLNIDSMDERREKQALNFAKKCMRNEKLKNMFPSNKRNIQNTRNYQNYKINFANSCVLQQLGKPWSGTWFHCA